MHEYHYHSRWARYYANEATMKRIDAVAFVEGKDDRPFWQQIFRHAGLRVNVITGSNTSKHTCGKQECLKYLPFLNRRFVVCIDSDYDYLRQSNHAFNARHYLLQTYTYAIENHYLASSSTLRDFLREYSQAIFHAFLRHIARGEPVNEFCDHVAPRNASHKALAELRQRLGSAPADARDADNPYARFGLTPDNTYLYIKAKVLKGRLQCPSELSFGHFPMGKVFADIAAIWGGKKGRAERPLAQVK